MKNISTGTVVRTVLLIIALVNQFLTLFGFSPLPFEDEEMTEFVSLIITLGASGAAWWKNNSFTPAAVKADEYLESLKERGYNA